MNSVKAKLSAAFKMRDLREAKYILRIEIKRNHKLWTISLFQSQYFHKVLECTGMFTCKPVWTPMAHNLHLSATDPEDDRTILEMIIEGKQVSYLSMIGSLMYFMLGMHLDIAYWHRNTQSVQCKAQAHTLESSQMSTLVHPGHQGHGTLIRQNRASHRLGFPWLLWCWLVPGSRQLLLNLRFCIY